MMFKQYTISNTDPRLYSVTYVNFFVFHLSLVTYRALHRGYVEYARYVCHSLTHVEVNN